MKRIIAFVLLLVMICVPSTVNAASSFKIRYSGKTINYTGTQLKVTYDGKKIDLRKTPGILLNDVGMLPYEEVFVNSSMKAKVTYNKTTKKITMKSGNNTLIMKLGSKTATVNGKTKKLPAAPLQVKYMASGKTKILVPSRFTAENLGYIYTWYSKTGTVAIEKKGLLLEYGKNQYNYVGSQVSFTVDGTKVETKLPGFLSGGYTLASAKELFAESNLNVDYSYDSKSNILTLTANGIAMKLKMGSREATIQGEAVLLPTAPQKVLFKNNNHTYLCVPAEYVAEKLGFYYEYNVASKTANIYSEKPNQEVTPEDVPNEIRISKGNNTLSNITLQDDYQNRQYIITLPGNQVEYYMANPGITKDANRVSSNVLLDSEGNTQIILKTNIIRGFNVTETATEFVVTILSPKDMYSKIIYLDAGHGGSAPGALGSEYGNTLVEKDVNLAIVKEIKAAAERKNSDIKIYYSRLEDTSVSNAERAKMANEIGADIFLSIHINSNPLDSAVRGSLIMYSSKLDQQAKSALTSSRLASLMKSHLTKAVGSEERANTRGNIEVLNSTLMPSVLLEVAFLSNQEDVDILMDNARITKIGEGIYQGIEDILLKYEPKR